MVGETVELRSRSHKGKSRIQEHGKFWKVIRTQSTVGFSSERGGWLLVTPLESNNGYTRWVNIITDKDFVVL